MYLVYDLSLIEIFILNQVYIKMAIKALNYFPFGDCAYGFCFLHRMEFNKIQNWNSSTGKKT